MKRLASACIALGVLFAAGCGSAGHDGASPTTKAPVGATPSTSSAATTTSLRPSTTTTLPADAGTWSLVPPGPQSVGRPVAWTGTEILVAEGGCCDDLGSVDLAAYNPTSRTWRKLPPTPLTPRAGAAGVWTGTELVVAGGIASTSGSAEHALPVRDGAAWNAATKTWHRIATMPTTIAGDPTAVWTGREMLVWSSLPAAAGRPGREVVLAYNPASNTWRSLPASGLAPRTQPVTVWTGTDLIVWGGLNSGFSAAYSDGARLDPVTSTWRRLPTAPVPARGMATAVWTGHQVVLWGGSTGHATAVGRGASYDPVRDQWRALPLSPLRARWQAAGVWTGHFFVVIGGVAGSGLPVPGPGAAAYDPVTSKWAALPASPRYPASHFGPAYAADQRVDGVAVWTGREIVLVGGLDYRQQAARSDGVAWTPA